MLFKASLYLKALKMKKILLLGDYSSAHANLKDGLLEWGCDVKVASNGDGWKKIPSDIFLGSTRKAPIGYVEKIVRPLCNLSDLYGHDIVQLINPHIFYTYFGFNNYIIRKILNNNSKSFLMACGDDFHFFKAAKLQKYSPHPTYFSEDLNGKLPFWVTEKAANWERTLISMIDGVIPVMYEYEQAYKDYKNKINPIGLAVNMNKISYSPNKLKKKLVIFHGLNRPGFKGTRHVLEAFKILGEKYPNDLELICQGNMPLNEYKKVLQNVNVVIDQMYAYSAGMNALISMAMGKITLGGNEPESLLALGQSTSPLINILPSANSIISVIEDLLERRNEIEEMGYDSMNFVKQNHGHTVIAEKYIKAWRGTE